MYPLDLDVEERFGVDTDPGRVPNMLCQANLVGVFDFLPLLLKLLVVRKLLQLIQQGQVGQKLITPQLRRDQLRQAWIGLMQPSSRGDPVCHVGELVRAIDTHEIPEDGCSNQIRMKLGYTVDLVTANRC